MILGWSVVCSIVVWLVVNSMAGMDNPESHSLGLYSCCCLLGYCLLPMVVFALVALITPRFASDYQQVAVACMTQHNELYNTMRHALLLLLTTESLQASVLWYSSDVVSKMVHAVIARCCMTLHLGLRWSTKLPWLTKHWLDLLGM